MGGDTQQPKTNEPRKDQDPGSLESRDIEKGSEIKVKEVRQEGVKS